MWFMEPQSVQMACTSPPYYNLRDYKDPKQIGLEKTPQEYVAQIVKVFEGLWHVLRDDGTVWLNLGDSYANDEKWGGASGGKHVKALHGQTSVLGWSKYGNYGSQVIGGKVERHAKPDSVTQLLPSKTWQFVKRLTLVFRRKTASVISRLVFSKTPYNASYKKSVPRGPHLLNTRPCQSRRFQKRNLKHQTRRQSLSLANNGRFFACSRSSLQRGANT